MRVRHAAASFACEVTETGVLLPLTVNGRRVNWLLDTGANVTMISDAEAARLGLVIRDSEGRAADLAGGSTGVRTAIARRLVVGRTQLEDVPFLLTPADQMPWKELPPGKQGILGLPLAIALDALRWTRTGACHTGSTAVDASSRPTSPNLKGTTVCTSSPRSIWMERHSSSVRYGKSSWDAVVGAVRKGFRITREGTGSQGLRASDSNRGATDRDIIVIPGIQLKGQGKTRLFRKGSCSRDRSGTIASTDSSA